MQKNITKEFKFFIPIFCIVVVFAVAMGFVMPDKIPAGFDISGFATEWINKASIKYHIPVPGLVCYVLMTLLQFHYQDKNKALGAFVFHTKAVTIIFLGFSLPFSTYLYANETITNLWYIMGPAFSFLVIYIFILLLISGLLNKAPENKSKVTPIKSRKKKKKA